MRWLPLLSLLAACGPDEIGGGKLWYAYDYSPGFGDTFVFVDPADPDAETVEPVHMRVGNGAWELRQGADFDSGTAVASFVVEVEDGVGIIVDGFTVLPDGFVEGDTWDNGKVESIKEDTVVIGTYSEMIRVTVDEGPLAGPNAFVLGVGPVQLTHGGTSWEVKETGSL